MVQKLFCTLLLLGLCVVTRAQYDDDIKIEFSFRSSGYITHDDFDHVTATKTIVEFTDNPTKQIIVNESDDVRTYSVKDFDLLEDNTAIIQVEWNEGFLPTPYIVVLSADLSKIKFYSTELNFVFSYSTHKFHLREDNPECNHGRCAKIKEDGYRCRNCCQEGKEVCWTHNK